MEWWTLWVPFGATILGIIANIWINITQNKKQQEFQKELTKTQIDANLKAKARIEWRKKCEEFSIEIDLYFWRFEKNRNGYHKLHTKIY